METDEIIVDFPLDDDAPMSVQQADRRDAFIRQQQQREEEIIPPIRMTPTQRKQAAKEKDRERKRLKAQSQSMFFFRSFQFIYFRKFNSNCSSR